MSKKIPKNITKRQLKPEMGNFVYAKNNLFLYKIVYGSTVSLGMVFLLMFSFFVQGVEKVYANELVSVEVGQDTEPEPTPEVETVPEEPTEPAPEEEVTEVSPIQETVVAGIVSDEVLSTEEQSETVVLDDSSAQEEPVTPELPPVESDQVDQPVDGEAQNPQEVDFVEPVDETGSAPLEETATENTSPEEAEPNVSGENQATSSTEEESDSTEEVPLDENVTFEAVSVTQSDSDFSFNRDQCTQLASGSFYCHQPQENVLDDALFSAPDIDGDLEIFLVRNGVQTQVTSNSMDDASPYFDQNTNTLVWHRLIDDRYQVISFDIDSEKETQLTRTAANNMEPNRQGEYTVWQRWVDGGWNIILFDGETEKQITKTTSHNIAPYIHGSLVVWNRYTSTNEKTIEMYDIGNGSYVSVDDPDGMSVSNPRMVFVYDSLHPNGDIVTKGYDVLAKKFIDLDTLPRDLPDELPASDSTGETRALIQSKPSLKSEAEESVEGLASTTPSLLPVAATSTEPLTLDLTVPVEVEAVTPDTATSTVDFDLVIEPYVEIQEPIVEPVQE